MTAADLRVLEAQLTSVENTFKKGVGDITLPGFERDLVEFLNKVTVERLRVVAVELQRASAPPLMNGSIAGACAQAGWDG